MEMFIDVQCPVCQALRGRHSSPRWSRTYIADGKVQLHLKPWAFLGPQSFTGRYGVIAAAQQNKGYEYAKVLYDNQRQEESGWLTGREMAIIAASVDGLNLAKWQADVNSSASKETAKAVDALATQKKVQGTPTIFIGSTGGKLQTRHGAGGPLVLQDVEQALTPPRPAVRTLASSGGSAQRARFSCLTSEAIVRIGSASRFRWTSRFVGAGVFVVRPTASVHSRAP